MNSTPWTCRICIHVCLKFEVGSFYPLVLDCEVAYSSRSKATNNSDMLSFIICVVVQVRYRSCKGWTVVIGLSSPAFPAMEVGGERSPHLQWFGFHRIYSDQVSDYFSVASTSKNVVHPATRLASAGSAPHLRPSPRTKMPPLLSHLP